MLGLSSGYKQLHVSKQRLTDTSSEEQLKIAGDASFERFEIREVDTQVYRMPGCDKLLYSVIRILPNHVEHLSADSLLHSLLSFSTWTHLLVSVVVKDREGLSPNFGLVTQLNLTLLFLLIETN